MSFAVRPANSSDIDWLLGQLASFSEMFGTRLSLFGGSEEYKRATLGTLVAEHVVLVVEQADSEQPVGLMVGTLTPHFFNPKIRVLQELFWWVEPAFRTGRAGALLLKEFLRIGREASDWIIMSLLAASPVKRETLEGLGFIFREQSFVMEVPHGEAG